MLARDNPFRSERVEAIRYHLRDTTWDALMARLEELDCRAAAIGPHGAGKTTFLDELSVRLSDLDLTPKRLQLSADRPLPSSGHMRTFFADVGEGDIILLDGADLLGRMAWRRFKRRSKHAAGLVVACHREGLLPTLIECATDPLLLDEILDELVPGEHQDLHDTAHALFREHAGNIREVLRSLYTMCAQGMLLVSDA